MVAAVGATLLVGAAPPSASASSSPPGGSGAAERPFPREEPLLYRAVPDGEFVDSRGERRRLPELWQGRPVLLTLVFATCAGVCRPYVRSLREAVEEVGGAGAAYEVAVLSFDPRDTAESMADMAEGLGLAGEPGWTFGVVARGGGSELSRAVGFWAVPEGETGQFDHPAMVAAIDRGRVVRLLAGATVPTRRLREIVWDLRGGFVPAYPLPSQRVLFRCFRYRPESGRLAPDWGLLLLLTPGVAMALGTCWIFGATRRR